MGITTLLRARHRATSTSTSTSTSTATPADVTTQGAALTGAQRDALEAHYVFAVNAAVETGREDLVDGLSAAYDRDVDDLTHRRAA